MHRRFKNLETFHNKCPQDVKYARPVISNHGSHGPLHVGYALEWERDLVPLLDVFEQAGFPSNPDHNPGDPLGISIAISTAHRGLRSTAADLLTSAPDNLTIVLDAVVDRLLIEGTNVVGVEASGTQCKRMLCPRGERECQTYIL
jgi:choline dehydrogenase-like flavoprotein